MVDLKAVNFCLVKTSLVSPAPFGISAYLKSDQKHQTNHTWNICPPPPTQMGRTQQNVSSNVRFGGQS